MLLALPFDAMDLSAVFVMNQIFHDGDAHDGLATVMRTMVLRVAEALWELLIV